MPKTKILSTQLNYHDMYPCPACRVGKISHMPLMEAMSCDFCHQIFTVNLEKQHVKMPSRQPPLLWRWNGYSWTEGQLEGVELGWGYALAAVAFVFFPTALMGIVAYNFPPHPSAPLSWIPYIWAALTLISHLSIIVWLVIEVYQIPIDAYFRAVRQFINR